MKSLFFILIFIVILIAVGMFWSNAWRPESGNHNPESVSLEKKAVVYKSSNCGCCVGYIAELKKNGFDVETINMMDLSAIKQRYNIPVGMQSCHTTVIGDYFIEGHVPLVAVQKLLAENPDIDGIALPGMPDGSPGMPGIKTEDFEIHMIDGGSSEGIFLSI